MRPNIEEIEKRAVAASPGPWNWEQHAATIKCNLWTPYHTDVSARRLVLGMRYGYAREDPDYPATVRPEDADFIAHARMDIPNMVEYIRELERTIREMGRELRSQLWD